MAGCVQLGGGPKAIGLRHVHVSTRCEDKKRVAGKGGNAPFPIRRLDTAEELAQVANARRELMLRVHGRRLRRDDLEDCYSQAVLELLTQARNGARYAGRRHMANTIEQRFISRIHDRRRALSGRSPMQAAMENAVPLDGLDNESAGVADSSVVEDTVILRHEIQLVNSLMHELTWEQRLVLACQISLQMSAGECCELFGWSPEKHRKVAQRARARLRRLVAISESGVPAGAQRRISK